FALHQRGGFVDSGFVHLEHQFVVHLQQHGAGGLAVLQLFVQADHGDLDEVGGAALDGRVGRDALGVLAQHAVVGGQFGYVAAPARDGLDVAARTAFGDRFGDVGIDARVGGEVVVDEFLGLGVGDLELAG